MSVGRLKIAYLFYALFSVVTPRVNAEASDAIVGIYAHTPSEVVSLGTGFLISREGLIVTAYHVIRNATKLEIFNKKRSYSDVEIISLQPDVDLAVLKISDSENSFFPYLTPHPFDIKLDFKREIEVIGHPRGNTFSFFRGNFTKPSIYVSSHNIWDGRKQIFGDGKEFQLIELDVTTFSGISGAPVLYDGNAIGVLTSSLREGGTIAWAVPFKYIQQGRTINIPGPTYVKDWKKSQFENGFFRSLVTKHRYNNHAAIVVEVFSETIGKLDRSYNNTTKHASVALTLTNTVLGAYAKIISSENYLREEDFDTYIAPALQLTESLKDFGQIFGKHTKITNNLASNAKELGELAVRIQSIEDQKVLKRIYSISGDIQNQTQSAPQIYWQAFDDMRGGLYALSEAIAHKQHLGKIIEQYQNNINSRMALNAIDREIREILKLAQDAIFTIKGSVSALTSDVFLGNKVEQIDQLHKLVRASELIVYSEI